MARLLIVDDNEANLDIIKRRLNRYNHQIDTASDGIEALEYLNNNNYQLVFLDIEMPNLNGIETLKRIKTTSQLANNTVVMLTAHSDIDHLKECLQLGAADYVTKPVDINILTEKINALTA